MWRSWVVVASTLLLMAAALAVSFSAEARQDVGNMIALCTVSGTNVGTVNKIAVCPSTNWTYKHPYFLAGTDVVPYCPVPGSVRLDNLLGGVAVPTCVGAAWIFAPVEEHPMGGRVALGNVGEVVTKITTSPCTSTNRCQAFSDNLGFSMTSMEAYPVKSSQCVGPLCGALPMEPELFVLAFAVLAFAAGVIAGQQR